MIKGLAAFLAVTAGLAGSADARMHAPYRGHRIIPAAATETPPLDGFPTPTVAWSTRKLLASYSGPGIRLRRTADTIETDINFLGFTGFTGAPLDTSAMTTHCTATPGACTVKTVYDQAGTARDATQSVTANQPAAVVSCVNNVPCVGMGQSPAALADGVFTPATGVVTVSIVASRSSGTNNCALFRENGVGGQRVTGGAANAWVMSAGGGTISATGVTDATWHVATAVFNGAASKFVVDGVATGPVAITPSVVASSLTFGVGGSTAGECRQAEVIAWDNVVLSDPQIAALQANQRNWLGLP